MILRNSLAVLATLLSVYTATAATRVDRLDGSWSFRLDPEAEGRAEKWFGASTPFPDTIVVPGAWDAQGFGQETEKLRHNYIGKAWYKRDVAIPDHGEHARYFLRFGGVYRYATVWVNGHEAGSHVGYVSNFEIEITPYVKPGQAAIVAIEVDSEQRWDIDALQGCTDLIDYLFTYWGGIWSHVDLVARDRAWLEDHFVQPNGIDSSCSVSATIAGDAPAADRVRLDILDASGAVVATREAPASNGVVNLDVAIPDGKRWTPESPYLYTSRLTLLDGESERDASIERFGLRTIEIRDTAFYVNGVKYFLAGYGDDGVYPETMIGPCDKDEYVKRLTVAKSYGFNYVRHHSHLLPDEYYEACDEVGMFVSPELPIAYMRYYNRATPKAFDLYKSEWANAIRRYRNHPSIFDWCMGNELWDGISIGDDLYAIAKDLDPTRPILDTDGVFVDAGFVQGRADRDTLDFYTVMFDILTMPLENPAKFEFDAPKKPVISHETGNFVTFPRLDVIEEFTHNFKPFWLTPVRDKIQAGGLLEETPAWSEASEKLYYLCHKINLEALRKNPLMSGYHWWLLQPWWPGSNGLLDVYRRPTSVTPEQTRQINGPVVLLQDGLKLNYTAGERVTVQVSVSNFSGRDFNAPVTWRITSDTADIANGTLAAAQAPHGTLSALGEIRVQLPRVDAPTRMHLELALSHSGETYTNTWSTWVYPSRMPRREADVPLYVSRDLDAYVNGLGAKPIPDGPLPSPAVYLARQPSPELLDAASRGSSVVLLSPIGVFPTDWTTFKSAWWLGVFEGDSNAGTYVYPNPVTDGLTPDRWCDAGWFNLLQGAQTYLLDDYPAQPGVMIRALNTHAAPYPFSRTVEFEFMWRNKALLFETRVGEGALIVSGLNFDRAWRSGGPEGPWVLRKLIDYASTLPDPEAELPIEFLRESVASSPFSGNPLVSGFDELIEHEGPKAQRQSYREFKTQYLDIRQEEPLHHIAWYTAAPQSPGPATFVFAGAFPFRAGSESFPGFALNINGRRALRFDSTKTGRTWTSDDGAVTLQYVPTHHKSSWNDTTGLFYLAVPQEWLVPNERCRLEICAIGADTQSWFGFAPYSDILSPAAP